MAKNRVWLCIMASYLVPASVFGATLVLAQGSGSMLFQRETSVQISNCPPIILQPGLSQRGTPISLDF